jgi:ribosomal protein S18 acetylase RimI-like enzyme
VERIGPYRLYFRRDSDMPEISYARPMRGEREGTLEEIAAGFLAPTPRPLQVVTAESFRPETSTLADVRPITWEDAPPTDAMLAAAFVEGKPVAAGLHSPVGVTTEVAGVATAPEWRRKGLAGAVTSALVADAFARGCT